MELKKEYKNPWSSYSEADKKELFAYGERYRKFISDNKTERECVCSMIQEASIKGYVDIKTLVDKGATLKAGDKIYANYNDKALIMLCIGTEPLEKGLNILGAHLDSPRLDLKPNPLYEDSKLSMLKTHYYGGIKKYQWVSLPLAIHGVVAKKDGSVVEISIGEKEDDPVFGITDLLPHLGKEQREKTLDKAIEAEGLNLCLGTISSDAKKEDGKEEKESVKEYTLELLYEKYGITEEDFVSAELQIVPAGSARDYGLDRSMIMGYGQDDRVCGYASFEAQLEVENPKKTTVCILIDKEEIGSVGASGMQSKFFTDVIMETLCLTNTKTDLYLAMRRTLSSSKMLSSDVTAGYDPNYPDVLEKRNAAYFGKGVVFCKYTGSGGKSGSNDANAEYFAHLRKIMEEHNVTWQTGELGKIDLGGGGTIAYILAKEGMEVIDCGVPVHSMHAPWEVTSKIDLYEMRKAYCVFLRYA